MAVYRRWSIVRPHVSNKLNLTALTCKPTITPSNRNIIRPLELFDNHWINFVPVSVHNRNPRLYSNGSKTWCISTGPFLNTVTANWKIQHKIETVYSSTLLRRRQWVKVGNPLLVRKQLKFAGESIWPSLHSQLFEFRSGKLSGLLQNFRMRARFLFTLKFFYSIPFK